MLVYPTRTSKQASDNMEPLSLAYGYLKRCLFNASLCIAIGFSFRDEAINELFSAGLRRNGRLRLIIQDPSFDLPGFFGKMPELPPESWANLESRVVGLAGQDGYFGQRQGDQALTAAIDKLLIE